MGARDATQMAKLAEDHMELQCRDTSTSKQIRETRKVT